MEINEALSVARRLKNHFKVFEKLDEFINQACVLQNLMQEFESRKVALQQEISVLEREKENISKSAALLKKKKAEEVDEKIKELSIHCSAESARIVGEIEKLRLKKSRVESEIKEAETAHNELMETMAQKEREARQRLDAVNSEITKIKAKLE